MLDTDTCIYVLNSRGGLAGRLERNAGETCMSSITYGELFYGAENSQRVEANISLLQAFRLLVPVLPFDDEAASHFGAIKAHLRRAGTPCGPYDMLIGGHARSLDMTLVTNNGREFDRMPGLKVENWL
jgi:tRNA(fMet)-specific endonuclease VapC